MKVLLITPPLIQLNTPYPATPQLTAFLQQNSVEATQWDMSVDLIEKIYTRSFLEPLFAEAFQRDRLSEKAKSVAINKTKYLNTVDVVVRFLKGKDDTLATRIANREFLPEGGRFRKLDDEMLDWAFGSTGFLDRARHIASLYMVDLSDFISEMTTPKFALIKYAEQLSLSAPTFDNIKFDLDKKENNIIDKMMLEMLDSKIQSSEADLICFTVPFPGTLYSALKCGEYIKLHYPNKKIVIGGGYISTELRSISDIRIFDYVDFICYDDGELPLLNIIKHLKGDIPKTDLVRTIYTENDKIVEMKNIDKNIVFDTLPAPTYEGIEFDKYISLIEFTNPMHKLWSDGKWLKLTFAHGCYWAKCAFCDTSLDYIGRFESAKVDTLISKIEAMIAQTGITGFHFTDEALPPKLLIEFAKKIVEKGIVISFWGNIRFDKTFNKENCEILSKAGCIAVSGGLEVASPRVLKLINKGISIETAAEVAYNFTQNGIMVHAYLMYGFPTQTYQECVDSLEIVRQMFDLGLIQSGFWHRYAMTVHSPSGICPQNYSVQRVDNKLNSFANNAVDYCEESDIDYKKVGKALQASLYNYMQGIGFEIPLKNWFEDKAAVPTINKNYLNKLISKLD